MIRICPSCRAPSNTREAHCWVCRRDFDGTEPVIGEVPGARRPARPGDVYDFDAQHEAFDTAPWRHIRAS